MATRWMRWNPATHIFEYSTDGVLFNILPLNASIINEGTIDSARLPAGIPSTSGSNTWTGTNIISGTQPSLTFNETDQGTDLKKVRFVIAAGVMYYQTQNDAGTVDLVNLVAVNRGGQVVINPTTNPGNALSITGNSATVTLSIANSSAGSSSYSDIELYNNAGLCGYLSTTSSTYGTSALTAPSRLIINAPMVGGLVLSAADAAGAIRFFTAGGQRVSIDASGNLVVYTGYVYANGGIVESGRPVLLGYWKDVPFSAANHIAAAGTWSLTAGNVQSFKYTLVGKTMILHFSCSLTTLTTATGTISLKIPDGYIPASTVNFQSTVYDASGWRTAYSVITAGSANIIIYGNAGAGGWNAGTNTVYVNLDITIPIQ